MSSTIDTAPGRRHLTERQADMVQRLSDAALVEIRLHGYEGLTVRNVALRAGVAAATAYTYFASKDHLVTEVFWQQLRRLPAIEVDLRATPAARVSSALRDLGRLVASEPQLTAACTTAMLASDPDVRRLRDRIGAALYHRLALAIDEDGDYLVINALGMALSGALLQAGMGHLPYAEIPDRMAEVAELIAGRRA